MGNACCNYSGGKDPHLLEEGTKKNGKPIPMDPKVSERLMAELRKHSAKIVKI